MKITQAEFVISAVKPHQYPDDALPEIALAGRSNVGKSSLINKMIMRKNLARTSSQPGKTQQLNYYRVNDSVYFVDFPGYGYAKVSKTQREAFGQMIETYIKDREQLKLQLLIIDIRHAPSKDDVLMYHWLKHYNVPTCIVVTKADKVPKGKWDKHIRLIKETLEADPRDKFVKFSSETGLGRDELWSVITDAIGT
ncbi:ribosome biogenesis GTP-binding protein YihA/YsxC [Paenibacillus sp. NEAU-GSW1]|uniref:ribosome biogenesis GTP-binding protein YihA/YsxC n=1 Tax=Paenibacillus sp. NEAU-GSW1 TaxID=2682486 RepID=UPI0012E29E2E|nr:ribosome biogenesis GTP-binding protein YihA/YsxC [Paenibacillus sp. NEAU-GSW1]MUT64505.1 YihA family ribosome biogenesis GTP-binding protein [Paenibacillus sp. NEAU-GSW1]